ncbi:MAG: hypothetical protein AB2692_22660, partial [Candidatus Thiodiazotropha sp.]
MQRPHGAGHRYEITVYGIPKDCKQIPRIKDLREYDENGRLRTRKRRGREYPIYAPEPPLAYIDKIRGEERWTTSIFASPRMVTDALVILSGS